MQHHMPAARQLLSCTHTLTHTRTHPDAVHAAPYGCGRQLFPFPFEPNYLVHTSSLPFQTQQNKMTKAAATKRPPRLYVDGAILGYQRGYRNQNQDVSLIKIKNVDTKDEAKFYCGKKIAFVTRSKADGKTGKKEFRVQWGKVCRSHGSNGVVRCRFKRNLPPQAMGGRVRVMLYPSSI
jgi:large subunit ribosomal protein L35Ae